MAHSENILDAARGYEEQIVRFLRDLAKKTGVVTQMGFRGFQDSL